MAARRGPRLQLRLFQGIRSWESIAPRRLRGSHKGYRHDHQKSLEPSNLHRQRKHLCRHDARAADEGSTVPKISDGHGGIPYGFRVTAAVQLISTSEFPGRAATATVVRAGPPFGK